MSKARTLANLISDNAELADGQISVAEVVGAAPTASPTFTGNIDAGDNVKIRLGDSDDLQIYHSQTTGNNIDLSSNPLQIKQLGANSVTQFHKNSAGHGPLVQFFNNASSHGSISTDTNQFILSADGELLIRSGGGSLKLATTSTGIDVTGTAVTDGLTVAGNVSVDGGTIKLDGNYPVGTQNVALGDVALQSGSLTGSGNVAIGRSSLYSNTSGSENTAVGKGSAENNTSGNYLSAIGRHALILNTTGSSNTAVGHSALLSNTTASNNTAVGYQAAYSNTTGSWTTAFGTQAAYNTTTPAFNSAFGGQSLYSNTTGANNVAVGQNALYSNTTASNNTAVGYHSLYANTTGTGNAAVGMDSLKANTTGSGNSAFGSFQVGVQYAPLRSNTTGGSNSAFGVGSLQANTSASNNSAFGVNSLANNTTGISNTAHGSNALAANTTAANNTAVGYKAGFSNTTGTSNTFVGASSGLATTTGLYTTAVGENSGLSLTTSGGTFLGANAGRNTTGTANTFLGCNASGYGAGYFVTTGYKNTIIGAFHGNQGGVDIRTSSNNIVLSDGDGNPRLHINSSGTTAINGGANLSPTYSTTTSMNDVLTINSSSSGSAGVGHGSAIYFLGERNDGNTQAMAKIGSIATTNSGTSFASALVFHAGTGGSPNEKMRITSNGDLLVGQTTETSSAGKLQISGRNGHHCATFRNGNDGGYGLVFRRVDNTSVGSVTWTGSATSYNTSSDYRLKENVVDLTGASARVNQLDVKRFNFIADETNTLVDGFLAHEVATVVPEAINGTHNEVEVWKDGEELPDGVSVGDNKTDDDGNTIPKYQGIDQSKLVPLLTAALQEALAKIDAMEIRLTALEG